ncbi:MAG TPA: PilT/PilU family type 4a pilus ATPase [Polyangiales bacterium]|nr:PilT/PilU family type 4a pilus ATPase [Polyangiales bacterium]
MQQLASAVQEQSRTPSKRLGAILVELGFVNETQLGQLVEAQRQYLAQQAEQTPKAAKQAQPIQQPARPIPPAPAPPAAAPPAAPATGKAAQPREAAQRLQWLDRVLNVAGGMHASDVHVHSAMPIKARIFGTLTDLASDVISARDAEAVLLAAMPPEAREEFAARGQTDFTYAVKDLGRFRTNIYRQQGGPCGVFHFIPAEPPQLSDLGLPSVAAKVVNHHNGIVLITGSAGSGKTSTMAALINLINEERSDHVLSVEDPIEYLHVSKRCVVNQREVNRHTRSFAAALRSALREDPDVICVGELRDLETISLAMSAAETGHLVLGTMHTQGSVRTINRVIGAYPSSQQSQVRMMLSESLRAIISQKLLPRADGTGVVLACELLIMNVAAANLIRENRTFQLGSLFQTGRARGMRSMDDSLQELVGKGLITKKEAALHADDARTFK